jgi:hypothetical protein
MARLLVHVEGQTEETFVNEVLRNHLIEAGFTHVSARIMGNARLRRKRGGIRGWPSARNDLVRHLKEDRTAYSTTMVDYYGLPQTGPGAWPGRAEANNKPLALKAKTVEDAMAANIQQEMGVAADIRRFVPFVMFHEFEGLLFSDCAAFSRAIGEPGLESRLQSIREQFASPEEINDSPTTAPSKRVLNLFPRYEKPFMGVLAIIEIGLPKVREECPHFADWLNILERLADESAT